MFPQQSGERIVSKINTPYTFSLKKSGRQACKLVRGQVQGLEGGEEEDGGGKHREGVVAEVEVSEAVGDGFGGEPAEHEVDATAAAESHLLAHEVHAAELRTAHQLETDLSNRGRLGRR